MSEKRLREALERLRAGQLIARLNTEISELRAALAQAEKERRTPRRTTHIPVLCTRTTFQLWWRGGRVGRNR